MAQQARVYIEWLLSLQNVLPCGYCRVNFVANLQTALSTVRSGVDVTVHGWGDQLLRFVLRGEEEPFARVCHALHNAVSDMLQKKRATNDRLRDFKHAQQMYAACRVGRAEQKMWILVCPRVSARKPLTISPR